MVNQTGQTHHDTPQRAKVRGVCQFLQHHDLLGRKKGQVTKEDVFKYFGVSRTQGKKIIKCRLDLDDGVEPIPFDPAAVGSDPDSRTLAHDPRFRDNRGRPKKLLDQQVQRLDDYLEDLHENDSQTMWEACRQPMLENLADAGVDLEIEPSTLHRRLYTLDWHKRMDTLKEGNAPDDEESRYLRALHEIKYGWWWDPEWRQKVFCTDEWHFGFRTESRARIWRKPHHHNAPWTVKDQARQAQLNSRDPHDHDLRRTIITVAGTRKIRRRRNGKHFVKQPPNAQNTVHCVAMIGLNYKRWYWYDVQTNNNGKMDAATYKSIYKQVADDIAEFRGSRDFILWEDGDGSHTAKEVRDWKLREGITAVTNVHYCPETNPIEDRAIANVVKGTLRQNPHRTTGQLRALAEEGFRRIKLSSIAKVYADMPSRWLQLRDMHGQRLNR